MKKILFVSLFLFLSTVAAAGSEDLVYLFPSKTVYFGISMGGGSTEWKYLVDTTDHPNDTDAVTPTNVNEGGPSWGVALGYDLSKNFAIEFQYMQFADSHITFDEFGQASYNLTSATVVSKTDAYSLSGKFLVPVGNRTHLRAFAAVGAGLVQRKDVIHTGSCTTPYLSTGLDYNFTAHWIMESGFQYYTGFGASEEYPATDFIPFAWDAYARLAYQI